MPPYYDTSTSTYIWNCWTQTTTSTTSTTYVDQIWSQWMTIIYTGVGIVTNGVAAVSEEDRARWREQERLAGERRAQEQVRRQAARTRARSLLYDLLTKDQREYMEKHSAIPVVGSRGRRYCIHTRDVGAIGDGITGNVELLDADGKTVGRFCAHPRMTTHDGGILPTEDHWTGQLLHLMSDEDDFLRKANVHAGRRPDDLVLAS